MKKIFFLIYIFLVFNFAYSENIELKMKEDVEIENLESQIKVLENKIQTIKKLKNDKNKNDLKGKTIGVQLGTIQEQFAKENGSNPRLYNSFTEAFLDLQNQKIDGVIIASTSATEYLKTMKGIKKIDTIKDKSPKAAIAFRKADAKLAKEFSDAILELKTSDEYAKLIKKYFPEYYNNFMASIKKK